MIVDNKKNVDFQDSVFFLSHRDDAFFFVILCCVSEAERRLHRKRGRQKDYLIFP